MEKRFVKFAKSFTSMACSPIFFISINSELAAKYLPNNEEEIFTPRNTIKVEDVLFQVPSEQHKDNLLI